VSGLLLLPFALSLSTGCSSLRALEEEGQGFDKLSPNGVLLFGVEA
jgi:hypothetical protein